MARTDKTQKNATAVSASDLLSMFPPRNSCGPKSRSGWQRRASNFCAGRAQVFENSGVGFRSAIGRHQQFPPYPSIKGFQNARKVVQQDHAELGPIEPHFDLSWYYGTICLQILRWNPFCRLCFQRACPPCYLCDDATEHGSIRGPRPRCNLGSPSLSADFFWSL